MDEIHMDKTEELTHPSDDPYIRGLLAPGGELEWLWDATITLTIDGRVLFVDSDRGGRFSRRTLLIDPEDTGALFAVMFCPWGERRPAAGGYPIWEPAVGERFERGVVDLPPVADPDGVDAAVADQTVQDARVPDVEKAHGLGRVDEQWFEPVGHWCLLSDVAGRVSGVRMLLCVRRRPKPRIPRDGAWGRA